METRGVNGSSSPVTSPNTSATGTAAPEKTGKAKKTTEAANAANAGATAGKSQFGLDISPKAREISDSYRKAGEIARNTPDVREDRVAAIKQKLADGTYEMDSGKIADGIMREAILDHLADTER